MGRWQRLKARLLDYGLWPEPLHEHAVIADRERLREIDRLEDGLFVSLLTSRSVGNGKKREIERTHARIKALRVYRWKQPLL